MATLKKAPPVVMRKVHCQMFRKYVLRTLLQAAVSYKENPVCAYPFCEEPKGAKVPWVQCDECMKWVHFACSGLEQVARDETWKCILCD